MATETRPRGFVPGGCERGAPGIGRPATRLPRFALVLVVLLAGCGGIGGGRPDPAQEAAARPVRFLAGLRSLVERRDLHRPQLVADRLGLTLDPGRLGSSPSQQDDNPVFLNWPAQSGPIYQIGERADVRRDGVSRAPTQESAILDGRLDASFCLTREQIAGEFASDAWAMRSMVRILVNGSMTTTPFMQLRNGDRGEVELQFERPGADPRCAFWITVRQF